MGSKFKSYHIYFFHRFLKTKENINNCAPFYFVRYIMFIDIAKTHIQLDLKMHYQYGKLLL